MSGLIDRDEALRIIDDLNNGSFEWASKYIEMKKLPNIEEQRIIKDICIGGSTDNWCDHNCEECEMLEITPKKLFESIRRKRNGDSN